MKKGLLWTNLTIPLIAIGVMLYYGTCEGDCSALRGTLLGVDLQWVGILFMMALTVLGGWAALRPGHAAWTGQIRGFLLAAAVGGEIMLVRFQIVHDTYCPYCLVFGLCVVVLFLVNIRAMHRILIIPAILAGLAAFLLFFEGSVLPLYR